MLTFNKNAVHNLDNYKNFFEDSAATIFDKYTIIINEYLKHANDNIVIQNTKYFLYIMKKGLGVINYVFQFLLIYTKNLEIVYYNCQKAYIYYIEFIGQISEENHTFLQLNSNDAALFVYKKTIFDINNDFRTNYICDSISDKILTELNNFINIYNLILVKLFENDKLINIIKISNTELRNIMNKIIKIYIDPNCNYVSNKIESINIFILYFPNITNLDYLDIFIKKIKKLNEINIHKLQLHLMGIEINNNSPIKFINHLLQQVII